MKKKTGKRILSVTLKRMFDESPDTSYLGEYSNRPTSQFSIDRATDTFQGDIDAGLEWLERIESRLQDAETEIEDCATDCARRVIDSAECTCGRADWLHSLEEAQDTLRDLRADEPFEASWDAREYRYFNPSFNYVDKNGKALPENTPEEVRKYTRQDYDRMESLNRGNWCYLGIRAEAETIPNVQNANGTNWHGVVQHVSSGGLWGIESDSEKSYLAEVEQGELENLRAELTALGFSRRAISKAFQNIERKDS